MMVRWLAIGLVAGTVLGCGPSLRRVAHSRVYFERCYAADFDPRIPLAEKHACWTAWREHYTIGQPADRVRYARQRVEDIEHGQSVPRLPGLPEAAVGPRAVAAVTAVSAEEDQSPPEADAPPAETADDEELPSPRRRRSRRPRPLPRTSNPTCAAQACEPTFRACVDTCPEDDRGCETACEVELQSCARGCF